MINFGFSKPRGKEVEKYSFPVLSLIDNQKHTLKLNAAALESMEYNIIDNDIPKKIAVATNEYGELCLVNTSLSPINNSFECSIHKTTGNTFNFKRLYERIQKIYDVTDNIDIYLQSQRINDSQLVFVLKEKAQEHDKTIYENILEAEHLEKVEELREEVHLFNQEEYEEFAKNDDNTWQTH